MSQEKIEFTLLGNFQIIDGEKRFVPKSKDYYNERCSKMPLNVQFALHFTTKVSKRTKSQLAYYWVLVTYLSDYTGFTLNEMHDFIMRSKFGTKIIKLGNFQQEVRKSISDVGDLSVSDCCELIDFTLQLCAENEIRIPTAEELGYISNSKPMR